MRKTFEAYPCLLSEGIAGVGEDLPGCRDKIIARATHTRVFHALSVLTAGLEKF